MFKNEALKKYLLKLQSNTAQTWMAVVKFHIYKCLRMREVKILTILFVIHHENATFRPNTNVAHKRPVSKNNKFQNKIINVVETEWMNKMQRFLREIKMPFKQI